MDPVQHDLACRDFVRLITGYLEGALDPATAAKVRQHLAECPHCDEYLAQMRETIASLGYVPVETLAPRTRADLVTAFRGMRL